MITSKISRERQCGFFLALSLDHSLWGSGSQVVRALNPTESATWLGHNLMREREPEPSPGKPPPDLTSTD